MNEAHDGWSHCPRTRAVGRAMLPLAHRLGVRHLAMEGLGSPAAERANASRVLEEGEFGYLAQSDLRALVNGALSLGWTLPAYEADSASSAFGQVADAYLLSLDNALVGYCNARGLTPSVAPRPTEP